MVGERNNIVELLLHGCRLARDLESNLGDSAVIITHRCDEIIRAFQMAKTQIHSLPPPPPDNRHHGKGKEVHAADSGPRLWNPKSKRSSRNDIEGERRTLRVPVPQIGNTEVPPEDGFTWRKYGQKDILNAKHPRSYYKCTHRKLYDCPAKKQAQRLDDDPNTFQIVYRGEHICHMSATAPSVPPTPSPAVQGFMIPISAIHTPSRSLFPMDFPRPSGEVGTSVFEPQQQLFCVSCSLGSISAPVDPSTAGSNQQGRDGVDFLRRHHDQNPGLDFDFSDLMFNSGSSCSNSMDTIFPPNDKKD